MISTVAMVTGCALAAVGCAASSESSATEATTETASSTDWMAEAVLEGLCSAPSADNEGIRSEPPGDVEEANQVRVARARPQALEAQSQKLEPIGEATEDLTPKKWQEICTLGCAVLAAAGCGTVTASCTAGTVWSFGGILIPCAYAAAAACTASVSITTVCSFKCAGG